MTISVVQANHANGTGGGAAGTWTCTFGGGVTAGNTLFLIVFSYDSNAGAINSGSPVYNGSAYGAASQLYSVCSTGGNNVYTSAWMFPAINTAGGTTVGATVTGGNGIIDGNVGSIAFEVSGLGTMPAADRLSTQFQDTSSATTSSGTTSAIQFAPEIILGSSVGYGIAQSGTPSGFTPFWTNGGTGTAYCEAGYQVVTSSGGTYTWSTNAGGGADWSAGIVTIYAGSVITQTPAPASNTPPRIPVVTGFIAGSRSGHSR